MHIIVDVIFQYKLRFVPINFCVIIERYLVSTQQRCYLEDESNNGNGMIYINDEF